MPLCTSSITDIDMNLANSAYQGPGICLRMDFVFYLATLQLCF